MTDTIPTIENYRGVDLHDQQDESRLVLVRAHVDQVFNLADDLKALLAWIEDRRTAPESRQLAGALIRAQFEAATDNRRVRPSVDLDRVEALTASLGSAKWRSPTHYCSGILPRTSPANDRRNPVRRPKPLVR